MGRTGIGSFAPRGDSQLIPQASYFPEPNRREGTPSGARKLSTSVFAKDLD